MDNDDVLRVEDVADVRSVVLKTRRRVLGMSVVTTLLAAVLVWILAYYLMFQNIAASTIAAAVFLVLGAFVFVHWWRHYRSIFRQLDLFSQRVAGGETVYCSKMTFHSYR